MLRRLAGSTGAEDLALCALDIVSGTWYVECIDAYLEAVGSTGASLDLPLISIWRSDLYQSEGVGSSDNHRMHRCLGTGSSGATDFCRTRPIQRFFEFFLRVLLCMAFLFHPWDLEMFT